MPRTLTLEEHLSSEELLQRYRQTRDVTERAHWHIVWLKSQGHTAAYIAEITGYSYTWVRALIHRYNEGGAEAMRDHRHDHPGAPPMLDEATQAELAALLETGKASDGGAWTGPKVARWMAEQTGREKVHDQRGWEYLIRLGFSAQTPRPHHAEANAAEQAAFKKSAARTDC